MKTALKVLLVVGALAVAASKPMAAQTAEEIVQKQLGQLMIANANAAATQATLAADLQKAKAEIEDLKRQLAAQPRKNGPAPGDTVK